ncbi:oligosaccharide flippase family protein [Nocardioides sp.]|uniref:oligosaccharide flippase family protein n=1 Tax=Nocardioides sp. TaxID=35761 RepID=UPI0039E26ECE
MTATDTLPPKVAVDRRMVVSGAMWTAASGMFMRVANVAITAVVARLLTPVDFGVFAVAAAVFLVVSSLAELGMGAAITRSSVDPRDIAPTVSTLALGVGSALAVLMFLTAAPLAALLGSPQAAGPLRILSLCLVLNGLFAVPCAQLAWEFRQRRLFLAQAISFVPANAMLILLALHGDGATAFAWSRVAGQIVSGIVVVTGLRKIYLPGLSPGLVRGLLVFGLPLSVANLVNWTLLNADYLVIARRMSEEQVGTYLLAFTVASWPTVVLGSVLNGIVVPAIARVGRDAAARGAALVTAVRLVSLCALPVGALVLALARPVVLSLYGEKWAASIPVLEVLALYGMVFAYCLLLANVLVALGRTWRLLFIQLGWIVVLVPTMLWGLAAGGLPGVGWSHVAVVLAVALPLYLATARAELRLRWGQLLGAAAPAAGAALLAGLVARGVALLTDGSWWQLIAGAMAGFAVYVAIAAPLARPYLPAGIARRLRLGRAEARA